MRLKSLPHFASFCPTTPHQSFQQTTKEGALGIIAKSSETIQQLEATYNQHFSAAQTLSALTTAFSTEALLVENATCASAIAATLDAVDHVQSACTTLERYIQLTVPKMEDGGNFGVGIQLAAIKVITDQVEKLDKAAVELFGYTSARADALEKCKLPANTATKSSTTSISESSGTDAEKGDTKSNSTTRSTEEKSIDTVSNAAEAALRKQAVVAVDVRYHAKAKATLAATITTLLLVVDFMDKNQVKIGAPKGDGGSRNYSGSMY
jgi:Proteasome activator pa28 beta subunit